MTNVFYRELKSDLPVAVAGDGIYLIDAQGKRYLDASGGAAVSCLGHSDADVIQAIKDQLGDLDGDGFNESEGCYVVSGSRTVILIAGERERIQPVIKFRQPAVNGLPQVIANGLVADRSAYNLAWAEHGALLLHWRASIPAGERLELLLR